MQVNGRTVKRESVLHQLLLSVVMVSISTIAVAEVEVTPATGVRFGEADDVVPVLGLTVDFSLKPEKWLSVLWSWQGTELRKQDLLPDADHLELDIHYVQFGGVYRPTPKKKTQGFVTAGAGFTWFAPRRSSFDDELALSLMVGGGAIVPLSERVGLRFDGRGYFTVTDVTLSGVCGGTGCAIGFGGNGLFQFEGLIGLSIAF